MGSWTSLTFMGHQGGKQRPERWEERGASRGPGDPRRGMWPTASKLSLVLPCYLSHSAFMFLFKVLKPQELMEETRTLPGILGQ